MDGVRSAPTGRIAPFWTPSPDYVRCGGLHPGLFSIPPYRRKGRFRPVDASSRIKRANEVRSCDCPGCVDDLSEPHPQAKLNLALAIIVGTVDAERLAKRGGVGFEAGEERESREGAVKTSGADAVAGSFNLCNVLVVEQVERFREQFQLAKFAEIEVL